MKNLRLARSFLITTLCVVACFAQQTPPVRAPQSPVVVYNNLQLVIEGEVVNVHDGDTVTIVDQNHRKFHIRLQGIDAPELKQTFGSASQQNLARLVLGKRVTVFWSKVDKYRRTVGTIKIDGRDMNIEQVKAGLAWHFKKYEDEQEPLERITYAAAEKQARAAKLGLWQDANPTVPGEWRQAVKAKRWGPPPPVGTIVGNKNSMKYHRPDCAGYRDMAEKNRVFFTSVEQAEAAGYKRAGNCPAEIQIGAPLISAARAMPRTVAASVAPALAISPALSQIVTTKTAPSTIATNNSTTTVANLNGKIIGNKNSRVYHLPGCASYNRVSEKNQIKFDSVAEAESAGYKIAGNCSASKTPKED